LPTRCTLFVGAVACLISTALGAALARAEPRIDVTQGNAQPLPIALPAFIAGMPDDIESARMVTQIISDNLRRSRLFNVIDPAAYTEQIATIDWPPHFDGWRVINAQALVTGRLTHLSEGRLRAEVQLWDVFAGRHLMGWSIFSRPDDWRRLAHGISNAIYERLTGEKGSFDDVRP
jgi:TolB protein